MGILSRAVRTAPALAAGGLLATPEEAEAGFLSGTVRGIKGAAKFSPKATQQNLMRARAMESAGADPRSIYAETGFFRGADGKMRYEVSDEKARLKGNVGADPRKYPEVVSHPAKNVMFPKTHRLSGKPVEQARFPSVTVGGEKIGDSDYSGFYAPGADRIHIHGQTRDKTGTLAHETQHAIQEREGFASGTSPERIRDRIDTKLAEEQVGYELPHLMAENTYQKMASINRIERANKFRKYSTDSNLTGKARLLYGQSDWYEYGDDIRRQLGPEPKRHRPKAEREAWLSNAWRLMAEKTEANISDADWANLYDVMESPRGIVSQVGRRADTAESEMEMALYADRAREAVRNDPKVIKRAYDKADRFVKQYQPGNVKYRELDTRRKDIRNQTDDELYMNTAGEVEARNVDKRRTMTMDERYESYPPGTEDRPRHKQILVESPSSKATSASVLGGGLLGGAALTGGEDAEAGILLGAGRAGERIAQRYPTAVTPLGDPMDPSLVVDSKAIEQGGVLDRAVDIAVDTSPGIKTGAKTTQGKLKAYREQSADNLKYLYDQTPEATRRIAGDWYRGANQLASGLSNRYGVTIEQSSGVLAALSPQKDWYQNVSLADRVFHSYEAGRKAGDALPNQAHAKKMRALYSKKMYADDVKEVLSKPFHELSDIQKSMWIRSHDEAFSDRGYDIIAPTGESLGPALTQKGAPATTAWQSNTAIAKAVRIIENPSVENISKQMGEQHKVRNFYNNIVSPDHAKEMPEIGDVTIDTHAVAASQLMPLSGSDDAVKANFGMLKGTPSSDVTGARGTYGLNADIYRQAASDAGIIPRELQSVTWEAVRGLYPAKWKNVDNKNAIRGIWDDYRKGRINLDTARSLILEKSGGVDVPDWTRGPGTSSDVREGVTAHQGGLLGSSVSRRNTDGVDGRAGLDGSSTPATGVRSRGQVTPGLLGAVGAGAAVQPFSDKAIGAAEVVAQAGSNLLAPIMAAPHALIQATTSDLPNQQIEDNYQRILEEAAYSPRTEEGQRYSRAAQEALASALQGPLAAGSAMLEPLEPLVPLFKKIPQRARIIGRSLLDMSPL